MRAACCNSFCKAGVGIKFDFYRVFVGVGSVRLRAFWRVSICLFVDLEILTQCIRGS